ncbi:SRPBCC family protein [Mycobacterium sp. pUA109]|uniref:SRPBCC family protein n=1 Tax=Mycobacterium sp. pUA109 TaxID=3238982 RepID=UPI00351B8018
MPPASAAAQARTAATPETVYALLCDASSWPTWIDVDSVDLEVEGRDGGESVGAVRVFRFRRLGCRFTTRERIVELAPRRRFGYELMSGLPLVGYRAVVDPTPSAEGGTVITWSGSWLPMPGTRVFTRLALGRLYRQFSQGLARKAAGG